MISALRYVKVIIIFLVIGMVMATSVVPWSVLVVHAQATTAKTASEFLHYNVGKVSEVESKLITLSRMFNDIAKAARDWVVKSNEGMHSPTYNENLLLVAQILEQDAGATLYDFMRGESGGISGPHYVFKLRDLAASIVAMFQAIDKDGSFDASSLRSLLEKEVSLFHEINDYLHSFHKKNSPNPQDMPIEKEQELRNAIASDLALPDDQIEAKRSRFLSVKEIKELKALIQAIDAVKKEKEDRIAQFLKSWPEKPKEVGSLGTGKNGDVFSAPTKPFAVATAAADDSKDETTLTVIVPFPPHTTTPPASGSSMTVVLPVGLAVTKHSTVELWINGEVVAVTWEQIDDLIKLMWSKDVAKGFSDSQMIFTSLKGSASENSFVEISFWGFTIRIPLVNVFSQEPETLTSTWQPPISENFTLREYENTTKVPEPIKVEDFIYNAPPPDNRTSTSPPIFDLPFIVPKGTTKTESVKAGVTSPVATTPLVTAAPASPLVGASNAFTRISTATTAAVTTTAQALTTAVNTVASTVAASKITTTRDVAAITNVVAKATSSLPAPVATLARVATSAFTAIATPATTAVSLCSRFLTTAFTAASNTLTDVVKPLFYVPFSTMLTPEEFLAKNAKILDDINTLLATLKNLSYHEAKATDFYNKIRWELEHLMKDRELVDIILAKQDAERRNNDALDLINLEQGGFVRIEKLLQDLPSALQNKYGTLIQQIKNAIQAKRDLIKRFQSNTSPTSPAPATP